MYKGYGGLAVVKSLDSRHHDDWEDYVLSVQKGSSKGSFVTDFLLSNIRLFDPKSAFSTKKITHWVLAFCLFICL